MTEFDDVIRLLRENRPTATELELDQIKQRVRRMATQPSRRRQDMKSRLAILLMLVLGMVFSTAGAGIAIQGFNGTDASISQYATPTPTPTPPGGVLGDEDESGVSGDVQAPRQVENGSDSELPFTGFLALPVLLGGVALLGGGLVLRRRTHSDRS